MRQQTGVIVAQPQLEVTMPVGAEPESSTYDSTHSVLSALRSTK